MAGCQITNVVWHGAQRVAYTEPRARGDGLDANDSYLGPRRVTLTGVLYGSSIGDLEDRKQQLRALFTPTLAYQADPTNRGYHPFYFYRNTALPNDFDNLDSVQFFINLIPLSQPTFTDNRMRTGDVDELGLAAPWQVELEARDPRFYYALNGATLASSTSLSGTLQNRGDYPAPLVITLYVNAAAASIAFQLLVNGCDMTITTPVNAAAQVITIDSYRKIIEITVNGLTTTRMDIATFDSLRMWPEVAPGGSAFTWTRTSGSTTFASPSAAAWYEAFA